MLSVFLVQYSLALLMSFMKYLFKSFAHLLSGCLVLPSSKSYLYSLDISPLLDICFADIFFQSVSCVFICLKIFFNKQKFFILMKSNYRFFNFTF